MRTHLSCAHMIIHTDMHKYSGLSSTPQNVAMVGDDVSADLGDGALELGLHRYLGKLKVRVVGAVSAHQVPFSHIAIH